MADVTSQDKLAVVDAFVHRPDGHADQSLPRGGESDCPLVAIGGSAGSLEALQEFFHALPSPTGLSFVVVLHLSPTTPSSLPELLQHWTKLRVCVARHMQSVQPEHVYVIPPGRYLTCEKGYLLLGAHSATIPRRLTIDVFFRTLAESYGSRAAAIILSGADGDGSTGIQYVKAQGGLTLAQDPGTSVRPTMPQCAIASGTVDEILRPRQMPQRLLNHFGHPARGAGPRQVFGDEQADAAEDGELTSLLDASLSIIRERTGQDYARYRRGTLTRRLEHRMQLSGADHPSGYLSLLRGSQEETLALARDFLISVTHFFRDPEHFDAFAALLPELFRGKGPDDAIRVWVPGCATGEEAYSIAMLLIECAGRYDAPPALQIFGTDLDAEAIMVARSGLYPERMRDHLSPGRVQRFFAREKGGDRARRELREPVLFAVHDLLKDAPFARMDVVSCRNLLIYLTAEAQRHVLKTLRFSLRPGGLLFLGPAEKADKPLFVPLDAAHRLYRRAPGGSAVPRVMGANELLARSEELSSLGAGTSALLKASAREISPAWSADGGEPRRQPVGELSPADLRASHQELSVINQELRSATEELDINRQELQCINEELTVLNQQLSLSIDDVTRVNSDLKNFIDATDLGIIFLDRDLKIMRYTPAATRLFRLIPTDLGRPLADLRHNLRYDRLEQDVRTVLAEAVEVEREVADQQQRWFLARFIPYRTMDLQVSGVVLTFVEITRRKQAEEDLRASEAKYRTLFESIDVGFCIIEVLFDEDGRAADYRFLEANPAFINQTGLTDAVGKTIRELAPNHEQFWFDMYGKIALTGTPARFEHQAAALPLPRWYEVFAFRAGLPEQQRVAVLFRDIGERKRREAHSALLAEVAEDFNRLIAPDEVLHTVGKRLAACMGISGCLFKGTDEDKHDVTISYGWSNADIPILLGMCGLGDSASVEVALADRDEDALVVRDTGRHGRRDADHVARMNIGSFVVIPFPRLGRWSGSFSVTAVQPRDWQVDEIDLLRELSQRLFQRIERARAEAAMRKSEARLRAFVAATSEMVFIMNADWSQMLSVMGKDFVASTEQPRSDWMDAHIPDDDQAAVCDAIGAAIRSRRTFELEHRIRRLDGTIGWISSRAIPLVNRDGDIVEWFGTGSDITERKRAEAELNVRNRELERFNHVMVGRELRMQELKQEINTLYGLRGDPPPYKPAGEPEPSMPDGSDV
ncbi:MAG: PAS domain-containing protein [Nitrospira sp.]|nr:PAS domain-containing protein [Nitrospira sp.]